MEQKKWTKIAELKFLRTELFYDIANYAYIESDVVRTDDEHVRHTIADVVEDGNVDRIVRMLDLYFSEVQELLYPYTKRDVPVSVVMDNALRIPESYILRMTIPDGMAESTLNLLRAQIHEYLVCRALTEWMSISNLPVAEVWQSKAELARTSINRYKNGRRGRVRRPSHPW